MLFLILDGKEYMEETTNYVFCFNQCKIKSSYPFANVPSSENEDHREISDRLLKYSWDIMEDKKIRCRRVS